MSSHWGVTNGCVEIIHENGEKKYACKVCRLHGKRTPKNMAPRENQPRAEVVIDDSDDDDANNNNPDDAQVDPDDPNVLDDPNFTYTNNVKQHSSSTTQTSNVIFTHMDFVHLKVIKSITAGWSRRSLLVFFVADKITIIMIIMPLLVSMLNRIIIINNRITIINNRI
jgi:dihydropteroate synthase